MLRKNRVLPLPIAALVLFLLLPASFGATELRPTRRVLIFYEAGTAYPAVNLVDQGIGAALDTSGYSLEVYREYMDAILFPDPADQQRFREFYIRKYQNRRPDVIVTMGPSPLRFMVEMRDRAFPGVPIVFCYPNWLPSSPTLASDFTGVENDLEPSETIQAALRLQPGTNHIFVVGGTSFIDTLTEALIKEQLRPYERNFDVSYLTSLTMPDLLERIKHLPNHTIVLFADFSQDAAGRKFIPASEAAPAVAAASNAPVFSLVESFLNHGEVGGKVSSIRETGRIAGSMALRILEGEKPQDVPRVKAPTIYMFDSRALQRWGLSEKNLPVGSIVLNRRATFWEAHKGYVIAALLVLLAQSLAILGLLWQRSRKRQTEKSLAERLAFETLLSDLSGTFIDLPEEQVTSNIQTSLGRIAEFLKLDRITLFEASQEGAELTPTSSWGAEGSEPFLTDSKPVPWPWWTSRGMSGEPATFSKSEVWPEETARVKRYLLESGIESIASVPLRVSGEIVGALSFVSTKRRVLWTEDLVRRLKVIAEIFSNALKRKRTMHALLGSNSELKRSESVLRESEERLVMAIQAGRMYAFEWDVATDVIVRSRECVHIFNWMDDPTRDSGQQFASRVHPEDRDAYATEGTGLTPESPTYRTSYRVLRPDGSVIWLEATGRAFFDAKGTMVRTVGMAVDVTERKQAEEALASVSRRLIEAHEEERTWIARELHDDVNQRIALLAVNLERLGQALNASNGQRSHLIKEVQEQVSDLGIDIQALSHRLHSSKLEYLGLAAACEGFCREFSEQQSVQIDFHSQDIPKDLPQEIALCLFRVLQEALQNAAKHSGVRQFEVLLKVASNEIQLSVDDPGVGFDLQKAMSGPGLGFTSMKERMKLIDGHLSIDSKPEGGTTIHARAPLCPMVKSAAGR